MITRSLDFVVSPDFYTEMQRDEYEQIPFDALLRKELLTCMQTQALLAAENRNIELLINITAVTPDKHVDDLDRDLLLLTTGFDIIVAVTPEASVLRAICNSAKASLHPLFVIGTKEKPRNKVLREIERINIGMPRIFPVVVPLPQIDETEFRGAFENVFERMRVA